MVMDMQKQLKLTYFSTTFTKSHSLGQPGFNALLLVVRDSGLHPDGHGHQETTKINLFYHTQQLLLHQNYQKVIPWDTPGSMPYSWVSEVLDFTQMVMDIRKQLRLTIFIIPNSFCFNNIA